LEVYKLIPASWHEEMSMFTDNEFVSRVMVDGKVQEADSHVISARYNKDEYNPRDGTIVKAADDLGAFVEVYTAMENGINSKYLQDAKKKFIEDYRDKIIAGIRFGELYADF
jgi:putative hydrolases of HD superfamily